MRLNLLQHLTGENFHKTHNLRFVSYDFAAKYKNAITLVVIGLFGRLKFGIRKDIFRRRR